MGGIPVILAEVTFNKEMDAKANTEFQLSENKSKITTEKMSR